MVALSPANTHILLLPAQMRMGHQQSWLKLGKHRAHFMQGAQILLQGSICHPADGPLGQSIFGASGGKRENPSHCLEQGDSERQQAGQSPRGQMVALF